MKKGMLLLVLLLAVLVVIVSGCDPVCGDNKCESGENCASCPADCGNCINNSIPSVPKNNTTNSS